MTDPFITAARSIVSQDLVELRATVDGMPGEALDWKPGGDDTNSAAVLVTHVLYSTRSWLSVAVGATPPKRDREAEFSFKSNDPAALLSWFDDMASQINGVLADVGDIDWAAERKTYAPSANAPQTTQAAWALLRGVDHLREHVAHISLTRQLWDAR